MKQATQEKNTRQLALRALPEGAVPDAMDILRCGLQTVVKDEHKVR